MCTVTYVPQKKGFILTSNRDEAPHRSPREITEKNMYGQGTLFPRDTEAGGTWIATSDKNRVVCLLNGAFRYHRHDPPYRKSRGLILLEAFEYQALADFAKNYDFCKIEPFTLILCEQMALTELRWDGTRRHVKVLDPQEKHLWASATLYSPKVIQKRKQWFKAWQNQVVQAGPPQIMDFHRNAGEGDAWNDVVMNRGGFVQTVSITQIINDYSEIRMDYYDLVNDNFKQAKITLEGEVVESN
ncbi:MAG TPA: NRDE family protein [Saprospiraceae bacterium]|nr:NRDE family protein [Saprospiraceae bacterium]